MGRLSNLQNTSTINTVPVVTTGSTSGLTNIDVHIFVDENGNVTQIKKYSKPRLKYYIDPNYPDMPLEESCVIGVGDPEEGDCSYGTAMAIGDGDGSGLLAFAIYE